MSKLPGSHKRYLLLLYCLSVITATLGLIITRWSNATGVWGYLDMISLSI